MTTIFGVVATVTLPLAAYACAAMAEEPRPRQACARATDMAATLRDDYGERPVATGVQGNGSLLQVWASEDGRTWSVVVVRPDRVSCLVATGANWDSFGMPQIGQPL